MRGSSGTAVPARGALHSARLQDLIEFSDERAEALRIVFLSNLPYEMNPVVLNQRQKFVQHGLLFEGVILPQKFCAKRA